MRLVGPSGVVIDVSEERARGLLRDHRVKVLDPLPSQRSEPEPSAAERAPDGPDISAAFVCDECGATAKSAAGLAAHKRRHSQVVE